MKKSLLSKSAVALAAGMLAVGSAQAVVIGDAGPVAAHVGMAPATVLEVNPAGQGHMLLVPYYTAQGGNDTYLSIVNTDMRNGKAVKIRFRGASNSDDVLDFTILLSPGDVWAAAISKPAGQDLPKLTTSDKSCTLPAIPAGGVDFNPARLHQKLSAVQQASETREGYVEIFNMADIPPATTTTATLYGSIEHVNGTPRGCGSDAVNALLNSDLILNAATAADTRSLVRGRGLEMPTTGLMANWSIVNVPNATSWSGAATAIEARVGSNGAAGYGNVVLFPQIGGTNTVSAANAATFTADPVLRSGAVTALPVDFPDMSTPYLNASTAFPVVAANPVTQAVSLSTSFTTLAVSNEYNTLAAVSGKNDWTFTMPTRRYNVARAYNNGGADESAGTTQYTDFGAGLNFFSTTNVRENTTVGKRHQLCVTDISFKGGAKGTLATEGVNRISPVTADREEIFEAASATGAVFSPAVPGTPASFCGEASVLTFNNLSALSPEVAKRDFLTTAPEGWVRFSTPGLTGTALAGSATNGLPVLGTSFVQFTNNAAAAGVRGNYGLGWPHRTSIR